MAQYKEYSRPSVASGGCSYSTLSTYNQGYYGRGIAPPTVATVGSFETVVVPSFGAAGYGTLSHGVDASSCEVGTCSGYFDIAKAYPDYPNNCSRFTSRLCG